MTDEQNASGTPPGGKGRRRPAPMIELAATEIESKPMAESTATSTSEQAASPEPAPPAPPASEAPPQAAAASPAGEEPPVAAKSDHVPPRRGAGPWLPLGAGVAGGAAVLAALLIANLVPGRDAGAPAPDARVVRLEQQLRELAARPLPAPADRAAIDDLTTRLARIETALANPRAAATDPALANRISTFEGEVKAMAETVSILGRRSDETAAVAREARQRADTTAAALAELTQRVTRLSTAPAPRGELDALAKRVDATERAGKAIEAELAKQAAAAATASDKPLRLAVVASALKSAVERGDAYPGELAAAKALAGDAKALAPLEPFAATGVPSAPALARELAVIAPALKQAAQQAAGTPPRDGFLEKLQASAEKLVRVRPLEEVAGDDPPAIVSRIEVKATQADLAGALAELAKLPPALRAPADAWIAKAQARAAALEASRGFAAAALAGLGK
jgi:hypothetical protein